MKRKLVAALLAGAMALSMVACGGGNSTPAKTEAPKDEPKTEAAEQENTGKDVTLRFSWWGGDERLAATLAVIEQFETANPGVKIEPEYGGSDGYADKLATQLASGNEPDIIQIDPAYMSSFVMGDNDYFVDYFEAGFDFSQFSDSYLSLRANGRYGDRQLGIPTGMSGPALLINQDLVDEYQDEIGWDFDSQYTWDDLMVWGKKLHEINPELYLIEDNKEMIQHHLMVGYINQMVGSTYFDEETAELVLTRDQWIQMFEMIKGLYENDVIPPASYMSAYTGDALQTDPNWIDGKYVGAVVHNSLIATMTDANPDANYTAGYLPVMEGAVLDGWLANSPQLMCISKRSENQDVALAFLDYFFNDPTAQETLGVVRSTPPTTGGREICEKIGVLNPIVVKSADVLGTYQAKDSDPYSGSSEVQQILRDAIEAIGFGTKTAEQAADEVTVLLQDYIDSLDLN